MPQHDVADKPCRHCGGDHSDPKDKVIADLLEKIQLLLDGWFCCDQCGAPGAKYRRTEGDGAYWLCDSSDEDHGDDHYGYETQARPLDHIRAAIAVAKVGQAQPVACGRIFQEKDGRTARCIKLSGHQSGCVGEQAAAAKVGQ